MSDRLTEIHIKNYRSLADVRLELGAVNVFFGPNGSGKSTLLDALWFLRDCLVRDVEYALSTRNRGIGMLWHLAPEGEFLSIAVETKQLAYEIGLFFATNQQPAVDENLTEKYTKRRLIEHGVLESVPSQIPLPGFEELQAKYEATRLSFPIIADYSRNARYMYNILRLTNHYLASYFQITELRKRGSETTTGIVLQRDGTNLWSVLRNLHDRRVLDDRYDTIIGFMRQAFHQFRDLYLEQIGTNFVYGYFVLRHMENPVSPIHISDGYLQLLILLTALFTDNSLILIDEPETSLHPYAISVFAQAVKEAATKFDKQILLATHSPVLLDQFEPENIFATGIGAQGETTIRRVSTIEEVQDLLEHYGTGSLYMAEAIAPQSTDSAKEQ